MPRSIGDCDVTQKKHQKAPKKWLTEDAPLNRGLRQEDILLMIGDIIRLTEDAPLNRGLRPKKGIAMFPMARPLTEDAPLNRGLRQRL